MSHPTISALLACLLTGFTSMACAQSLKPTLLPAQPGAEPFAFWSLGNIEEVPAFVRTARVAGKPAPVCEPDLLIVQGEKFKLSGQQAEATLVMASEALHAYCKGEVWYAPAGRPRQLRADLRGEWHNAAGVQALQSGKSPKALAEENLEFPRTSGRPAVSVQTLQLEDMLLREHRQRWPTYQANLERLKQWQTRFATRAQVPMADWTRNPFAYADQTITSVVVFDHATDAQQVEVTAPGRQDASYAALVQANAASWKPGAWLVVVQPQPPQKRGSQLLATARLLDKQACTEFDCRDLLLVPGDGGLPNLWGKTP